MSRTSDEYIDWLSQGPFPNHVDPWAERGQFFQHIHDEMISYFIQHLRRPLLKLGYSIGREDSLQITQGGEPDLYIEEELPHPMPSTPSLYSNLAQQFNTEAGLVLAEAPTTMANLGIRDLDSNQLVTSIEFISPNNKTKWDEMETYQERRAAIRASGVHIVEIDLTRSKNRLIHDKLLESYAYSIVLHLAKEPARFIGMDAGQPLKSFTLPLRHEGILVELEAAYRFCYIESSTALRVLKKTNYEMGHLPFPSLLSPQLKQTYLAAIQDWKDQLEALAAV